MLLDHINQQPQLADASKAILKSCFHAFLAFCGCEPNPAKALPRWRETPRRIIVPNDADVKRALDEAVRMSMSGEAAAIRDGLIFALSVVSGNRRGELRNLPIKDLQIALNHPENGVYRVFTNGKTGEAATRFTSFHVPLIERWLEKRPFTDCPYLFVNHRGQHLSLVGFDRARPKVCQRAGVPIITYQQLRRRLATHIANNQGVDVAAHALNHSPHSGDRVIRAYYYNPDIARADKATASAFKVMA
ncbi:MAG: tyrosine-type recombinase/integrase [Ardenticatenaceae bacterium]|nr:tyrosine-type recombinase/integrase [Ardenticatenaceae bacterium]